MTAITFTSFALYAILCGIGILFVIAITLLKDKVSDKVAIVIFITFVGILIIAAIALIVFRIGFVALVIDWFLA